MDNDNLRCNVAQKEKEMAVVKQDNDALASELRKAKGEIDILMKTNEVDIKNINAKWEEELQNLKNSVVAESRNSEEQLKVKNAIIYEQNDNLAKFKTDNNNMIEKIREQDKIIEKDKINRSL